MFRTLLARLITALAVVSTLSIAPALAQEGGYRTPPAPVGDILSAPRLPRGAPDVSPDGARMIVPDLPSLVPIEALAEPVEKLAGLEIVPRLRSTRGALKTAATGFGVVSLAGGGRVNAQLPAGSRVMASEWSNDSKRIACALLAPGGAELWIVDALTGAAKKIDGVHMNRVVAQTMEWSNDDKSIFCAVVPETQVPLTEPSRVPDGPQVRVGAGRATPQRTARDVLRSTADQNRFTYYCMAQLVRVNLDSGSIDKLGVPCLIRGFSVAPDEKHFVVERYAEKVPLGFPHFLFAGRIEVWNADGNMAARLGVRPLDDRSAISSVARLGPREMAWSPDGSAIYFFSWLDREGADPTKASRDTSLEQPGTDRLMRSASPFTSEPEVVATSTDMQFFGMGFLGTGNRMLLFEGYEPRRIERRELLDLATPSRRRVLTRRSTEGVYDDPGFPLERRAPHGTTVWTSADGKALYLAGAGFRKDGQRPFLDRVDLATGKSTRMFESDAAHLETVQVLLDAAAKRYVTARESNTEPRNFWLRAAGKKAGARLTAFADPAPALTTSQRFQFTFTRPDSVKLNAEAVLPADWKPGHPLPTVFWIYPNDYRSATAASQNRRSPNRFPSQSPLNPEVLVTQGYCVVYPDIAIVGTNDRYVPELQMSARAAVDECVRRGYTDRDRIGVGGHSYGAFSTANMLAHTELFRAGVASDGAYNRTLTPFTFQAEERTLWQARDTYLNMSPFLDADKIHDPLLLMHNLDDTNVGTNPIQSERMYEALNGMGRTVSLVNYPYEDHGPAARETVLDYWARAIEWYDKYVKQAPPRSAIGSGSVSP